jgi:mannose-1-phosphate guanylyltransferase
MAIKDNNFCVILAGGKGRRLWPCSRQNFPKQFIDFFGVGRTQLQQTFDRFSKFIPKDNIYVSTSHEYEYLVKEQLPELSGDNILSEPIHRNTAPSVAWAVHRILRKTDDANIVVTPSDQTIYNEDSFKTNVLDGLDFVERNDSLLTMGVKPTWPETGYGYVQLGEPTSIGNLYKVKSFTEKPDREFAKMFMKSGEFYWNTGLFLANVRYLRVCFCMILPPVLSRFEAAVQHSTIEEENEFIKSNFSAYPNLSIDYGILEKSDNVYVMKCDFGWADLGTWHGIYEFKRKGEDDNVVIDSDVIFDDAHNNVVKLPQGKMAVINGLDGFIVAEKDNMILICKKQDSSALIRKFVNEVQLKKGDDYI